MSEDAAEWLRMRQMLWPDCSAEMHALEIAEQQTPDVSGVLVYQRPGGGLGGFLELSARDRVDGSLSPRVGYVEGWHVDPDLRGQGIGRELMRAAEAWTLERGLTELASDAELWNEEAIRAHYALGFRETFRVVQFLKTLQPGASPCEPGP